MLLRSIVKKYSGAVLGTHIRALAVGRSGVVAFPEHIQQIAVGNLCRIEGYLHRFGMAGAAAANVLIAGVIMGSAGIADGGGDDARNLSESRLHAPETTGSEGRFLHTLVVSHG